jgi:hypothetical protein
MFFDRWLEQIEAGVAPRIHECYREIAKKNIAPLLGQIALTKLRPDHISMAYVKALKEGRGDGTAAFPLVLSTTCTASLSRCWPVQRAGGC